jgi:hypothetical protein
LSTNEVEVRGASQLVGDAVGGTASKVSGRLAGWLSNCVIY